jgi:hypothetical protein
MFRRPALPPPPVAPLGAEDLLEQPRPPLISRENVLRGAAIFLGGIAWGAAVRFADSLPVDLGFPAFVLKVGVGFCFVVAILLLLLFRGFEVDRVALVAVLAIGGGYVGLSLGPTVAPPVTVTGTFSFTPSEPAAAPSSAGEAECEWASGRWKIATLRTPPVAGFETPHRLSLDFLRRAITLTDGEGSALLAVGNDAFAAPSDAPPRGEGDRSGILDLLLLQVDPGSTPDDPNEVRARVTWECPAPPPG